MSIKKAKILEDNQINFSLLHISQGENPERDQVLFLLSIRSGLRAAEIAGLRWIDVTNAEGSLADIISIGSHIGKGKKDRVVPMHQDVRDALLALRMLRPNDIYIAYSTHKLHNTMSANAVTLWFKRLYEAMGFQGCSSHSGRRTVITALARRANLFDCSLKDVQRLAGHARLETTEGYIEYSDNVPEMVASL